MTTKPTRPSQLPATKADLAKLQQSLKNCTDEIEHLKAEIQINIRRMAAMQAEIDHLRAVRRVHG